MNSLKKFALAETSVLHLRDGNEELMYADGADGKPDESKPMRVYLFGPGSKQFAKAKAAAGNRAIDRLKKRGKSDQTAEDNAKETADFLTSCTQSMENIDYEELTGAEMFKAIYLELDLCFIPMQIDKYLSDTANFTKGSTQS